MNNFRNLSSNRGYFYFQLILIVFVYTQSRLYCQEKVTLSGYVSDSENNETLIGVNVIIPNLKIGTTTNDYGFYSLTIPRGDYKLQISFLGYKNQEIDLIILSDFSQNFNLQKEIQVLDEVVIEESSEFINLRSPEMSVNRLSISTIKKIPAVLGETDVIKSITLLPGVTNAGEGASGFNVRGGGADQNLILLDEAIIFNSSHLFGFFSVFNPESIKDVRLYKGGIPAKYGGRVSSVLNIFQKEGNKNKFNSQGGIGLISSRLLLEGPIKKETTSFLFGGRSSYAHLFLPLIESVDNNKAYFYDLNTKLSHRANEKNTIFLSGYFGRDVFDIDNLFDLSYGNSVANFRWNHLFSNKLFSNLSMIYSDYDYTLDFGLAEFDWNLGITNFNLKYDLKYYLNEKIKIEYGLNSIYYKFDPGLIQPTTDNSTIQNQKLEDKFAVESAFYSSLDYKLLPKLQLNFGLRLSNFLRLGQKINTYENDNPLLFINSVQIYEEATPLGFIEYSKSEVIKQFTNLEPRFSLAYEIADNKSFKISYNRMAQYLHLISNTNSPTPIDVWAPSGKYIDPQLLNQVAVGYFETFNNKIYSLQAEVFYKTIKNRLDYIDGAELIANDAIEQVLLNGEARASGIEILFQKNEGKLTGWIAYTLSKSEQRTPGRTEKEIGINNGNWYFTPYDKTHDFSLVSNYRINARWNLNFNFIFQTGQPITYPNAQYQFQRFSIPNYEARNSSRLPSYHRLDISAIYKPKNKAGEWVFGIYNIYNRKNAASIRFQQNINNGTNEAIRLAIFGIIPSVTYNFKF